MSSRDYTSVHLAIDGVSDDVQACVSSSQSSDATALPLFDTRISSLPQAPVSSVNANGTLVDLEGFPLVFEDQYLQLTSALPLDPNVYGLGEVVARSGFRRSTGAGTDEGGKGTVQTMWARNVADPIDNNL